jgi:hypothetical protein
VTAALGDNEFSTLFLNVQRSARRLENRNRYDVDYETPEREAFLAGERPSERPVRHNAWDRNLQHKTGIGVRFERVRIMDEPLTPYNRFMIWGNAQNRRNGEDIRYLTRSRANELALPDHDFWVLDSTQLVLMRFTADDRPLGHELITDPELIARHEHWIDQAMAYSIPWTDYVAEDPTRVEPPVRITSEVTVGGM